MLSLVRVNPDAALDQSEICSAPFYINNQILSHPQSTTKRTSNTYVNISEILTLASH